MSTQTIGNSTEKRDEFLASEINRFVKEFQAICVRVTPENAEERIFAFVYPPYMLQSVTLIDYGAKFEKRFLRCKYIIGRCRGIEQLWSNT
jgi:hypothetical protein